MKNACATVVGLAAVGVVGILTSATAGSVSRYNVVWEKPSADHTGQMPLGNGDIAAGVCASRVWPDRFWWWWLGAMAGWSVWQLFVRIRLRRSATICLLGGWFALPLDAVFPAREIAHHGAVGLVSTAVPLAGLGLAYLLFLGRQISLRRLEESAMARSLARLWLVGWGFDAVYDRLFTRPFTALARLSRREPVDAVYNGIANLALAWHAVLSRTQTGRLRWYAASVVLGLILLLGLVVEWTA